MATLRAGWGGSADWQAGSEVVRRSGDAAVLAPCVPEPSLDYYLIYPHPGGEPSKQPEGIVVEEFVLAEDYSAVCLNSIGWSPRDRHGWSSSAAFSRGMRVDPRIRSRVIGIARREVEIIYRQLGGGELPDEDTLRTYFQDGEPLSTSAPLRLSPGHVAAGFHDTRVYRILFANELDKDGLANLQSSWRMTMSDTLADPRTRVVGTAHRRIGGDAFAWDLRRIGTGAAWCVDLTANLASSRGDAIGPLLRELTTGMRTQGLIPVTVERFA